jgi:DNA-binding transcriptional MerR regulator
MRDNMVIDLVAKEKTYSGKEVADHLGIGISTLRKWSRLLEENGHLFPRSAQNGREYRQSDIGMLLQMKELYRKKALPLEQAAQMIIRGQSESGLKRTELPVSASLPLSPRGLEHLERLEQKIQALAEHARNQEAFNQALLERVQAQEKYIESSLKERDRRLTRVMSDILEAKLYVAAAKEKERKTSIWHRLFHIHL